jgi:hypothetical protein
MIERTDSFITSTHGGPTQNNRLRQLGSADVLSDANGNMLSNQDRSRCPIKAPEYLK